MNASQPAPRVRAVTVNFNGGPLTLECLAALHESDWPAECLEIVLVDNDSHDGVVETVRRELPDVRVIETGANLGFAGGSNEGMWDLDSVDYVALVNNDVKVTPAWLSPLVSTLEDDDGLGAACPKILFSTSFVDVELTSSALPHRWGDPRTLGVRVSGIQIDGDDVTNRTQFVSGFWGPQLGPGRRSEFQWTAERAILRVPAAPVTRARTARLELAARRPTKVVARSGDDLIELTVETEPRWFDVPLGGSPQDIINNVGSVLTDDGYGADRGYLEPDDGRFDAAQDVFAWCGAAVLLSKRYLSDVGMLDPDLFLYYEDLELSWRGRERGWRYRYVPSSVVRHVHAASSREHSRLFRYQNERNRLLVLARHAEPRAVLGAIGRFGLVTASYARRDVMVPILNAERPTGGIVGDRLRAFGGFLRHLPKALRSRHRDRTRHPPTS